MPEDIKFPESDHSVLAEWAPIYIEPMVGSGERLTIGVAVANSSGFVVSPVSGLARLKCVYGAQNEALLHASQRALEELRFSIQQHGSEILSRWDGPYEGIITGTVRQTAGASLEAIAQAGLMMCSAIPEAILVTEEQPEVGDARINTALLEAMVKKGVSERNSSLSSMFNKQIKVDSKSRAAKVGYVGKNLAANFGLLVPSKLTTRVKDAKSKLWDLEMLRDKVSQIESGGFGFESGVTKFELLTYTIGKTDPLYSEKEHLAISEALHELEESADRREIICRPFLSTEKIVGHIIEAEAA